MVVRSCLSDGFVASLPVEFSEDLGDLSVKVARGRTRRSSPVERVQAVEWKKKRLGDDPVKRRFACSGVETWSVMA